jgi:hypothetical protein
MGGRVNDFVFRQINCRPRKLKLQLAEYELIRLRYERKILKPIIEELPQI